MLFRVSKDGANVNVRLEGQLNFASNEDFHSLLSEVMQMGSSRITFDMSGLSHIDSVGLGLLYIAKEDLNSVGASLCLASPKDNVFRLLELTEANKTFEIKL
jgi:anti-sigma B factor antagonist